MITAVNFCLDEETFLGAFSFGLHTYTLANQPSYHIPQSTIHRAMGHAATALPLESVHSMPKVFQLYLQL
jgi:hypothetical protein